MRIEAFGKLNLSLLVGRRRSDGYHPVRTRLQSVDHGDLLSIEEADDDRFEVVGDAPDDESNLAWRALTAARQQVATRPVELSLTKRIPPGSGMGGGSADAASVLWWASDSRGLPRAAAEDIARSLGADVAFCLRGGSAIGEGRGDELDHLPTPTDHAYGVVVPPFELSTPTVYRRWDELDEPVGPEVPNRALPPSLRDGEPIRNDLLPAALAVRPDLGDLMADLADRWGRPVLMTGSGSALFAFFADHDEAAAAIDEEAGWSLAVAAEPAGSGRRVQE